jgi:hypothetical protein
MSKYVDEIILSLEQRPNEWRSREGHELYREGIQITGHGNSTMLSIIDVWLNGIHQITTWKDRYRLERAVSKWFRVFDLKIVTGINP